MGTGLLQYMGLFDLGVSTRVHTCVDTSCSPIVVNLNTCHNSTMQTTVYELGV